MAYAEINGYTKKQLMIMSRKALEKCSQQWRDRSERAEGSSLKRMIVL